MLNLFTRKYSVTKLFSSITLVLISICISFYLAIYYPHELLSYYSMSTWFTVVFDIIVLILFLLCLFSLFMINFLNGTKKVIIPFVIIVIMNSFFIQSVSDATNAQLFTLNFKSNRQGVIFTHSLKTNIVCGKPLNRDAAITYLPGSELKKNGETQVRVLCPINRTFSSLLYKTDYVRLK